MGEEHATLLLRVTPRSTVPGVGPWRDGVLQVRVRRPPVEGQATMAALAAVADALGVPRTTVRLARGERSRLKHVVVAGMAQAALVRRLEDLSAEPE